MYCAYTIPGMTGSSLMYYYNGKAVRQTPSISSLFFIIIIIPPCLPRGFGSQTWKQSARVCLSVCVCVKEKEREREGGAEREEV